MGSRSRNYLFTYFPDPEDDETFLLLDPSEIKDCKYCIYQYEQCPETLRVHLQGYIEFNNAISLTQVKERLHAQAPNCHLEPRRGSQQEAVAYCSKEESRLDGPYSFGDPGPGQGARKDIDDLHRTLNEGATLRQVSQTHFPLFLRYERAINSYIRLNNLPRSQEKKTITIVFHGPSGIGKTRSARLLASFLAVNPDDIYEHPIKATGTWFDGYRSQSVAIMDEFSGATVPPTMFNVLSDRGPCVVPCHGTAGNQWNPDILIITTNTHPRLWWKHRTNEQYVQTRRRIDLIFNFHIPPSEWAKSPSPPEPPKRMIHKDGQIFWE